MNAQQTADSIARATGSISATARIERRNADGTLTTVAVSAPRMQTNLWGDAATRQGIRETYDLLHFAVQTEAQRVRDGKGDQGLVKIARRVAEADVSMGCVDSLNLGGDVADSLREAFHATRTEAARCWLLVLGMDDAMNRLAPSDHLLAVRRFLAIIDA